MEEWKSDLVRRVPRKDFRTGIHVLIEGQDLSLFVCLFFLGHGILS